jgi:roadblock/LC7 domain-containing protein
MLKRLLVLDGVVAVCRFQDDGAMIEGVGLIPEEMQQKLTRFAHWYRRMVSGNSDVFSLFSQMNGWTPARGWIVKGDKMSVCGVGNVVAMLENKEASVNQVMQALEEVSHE